MAFSLEILSSFKYDNAEAITFDRGSGNLFTGTAAVVSFQPFTATSRIDEFTRDGKFVSTFVANELFSIAGVAALPNNNLLIASPIDGRIVEYTKSGQRVAGGIDFTPPQLVYSPTTSAEDMVFNPSTGTIFIGNGNGSQIYEFDPRGNLVSTLDLTAVLPTGRYKGVAIDPLTGNFLVTVDQVGDAATDNKMYEITRSGQVLGSLDLLAATGYADPEGLAIDPATRTLYAVFDGDDAQGANVYLPNRNWAVAFKLEIDSFAGDTGANDSQVGDAGANSFLGGAGSDTYSGGAGDDIIDGGLDNDILNGNEGNDQIVGGAGIDFGRGGNGDDGISGGAGDDTLFGDVGNDNIAGGAGNDIINGNLGNDILNGGEGNDLVRGGRGDDYLTGAAGNDTVHGDEGFDTIDGGEGNDSLLGESGEDVIYGGMGNDTLIGGGSRDSFVLAQGTGNDVIVDFVAGTDSIGLTNGVTYDQLSFTQEQVNNVITTQIRFSATGEILASLQGVNPTSINRSMFALR